MALDLNRMLMPIQPLAPMPLGAGPGENLELERQRLELMRQQFDETKRRNAEEQAFQQMEEQGRNARQQLQLQQAREEHAAVAKQKMDEDRRAALGAVLKAHDAGDFAGMEAAALQLNQLGGMADKMSTDAQGFPSYRIGLDRAAWEQQQAAQEAQAAPRTENPGDETAAQSLDRMSGLGYGLTATQPDASGNVPANVLDAGLEHQALVQRLSPALDAYRQSFAPAYQESTGHTNDAALAMSMNPKDVAELSKSFRTAPDASIAQQLTDQREQQKEQSAAEQQARSQQFQLRKQGLQQQFAEAQQGRTLAAQEPQRQEALRQSGRSNVERHFKDDMIGKNIVAWRSANEIRALLDTHDAGNDARIVNKLMDIDSQVGPQSDRDAERVTGLTFAGWKAKFDAWRAAAMGDGFSPEMRDSITSFIDTVEKKNKSYLFNFIDQQTRFANDQKDSLVGEGARQSLSSTVPQDILDEYDKHEADPTEKNPRQYIDRKPPPAPEPALPMQPTRASYTPASSSSPSLEAAATAAGLDPEKIAPLIGRESGGDPTARSSAGARGIIQMMPDVATGFTNPRTGQPFKNADEFATLSREEQLPIAMQYFKSRGVTKDSPATDYALALAAPGYLGKPRDTVIEQYRKGTKFGDDVRAKNPGWIPRGGGDITVGSILDFYGQTSSGAPRTSRRATADEVAGHEAKPMPQAKSRRDQQALDILNEANQ